jgi:hypothetical protein
MSKADEDAVLLARDPVADLTSAIGACMDLLGEPWSPPFVITPVRP